jgi:acetyl esterase/lipase
MRLFLLLLVLLFSAALARAQKKPLDHSVYDAWQHIGERLLSADGRWVVYTVEPQEGDGQLVVKATDGHWEQQVPRGFGATITEDGRHLIFRIRPLFSEIRAVRQKKKKADQLTKDSLGILDLVNGTLWKREGVKGYKTSDRSAGWVAYQVEKPIEQPGLRTLNGSRRANPVADSLQRVIDSLRSVLLQTDKKRKKEKEEEDADTGDADGDVVTGPDTESGNDLVVRNLHSGEEIYFYRVLEYYFSREGAKMVIEQARNPNDSFSIHQVVYYDPASIACVTLSRGGKEYRNFVISEDGSQVAYLAERDARPGDPVAYYRLWHFRSGQDSARLLADKNSAGMRLGMTISEHGNLNFSKSGRRLFFGVAPVPVPKDTTITEAEMPKVDIWHYNDEYLQTVQTLPARLRQAQQENWMAVYDFAEQRVRQLGSREVPQVLQTAEGDGAFFVGISDQGKRIESQWNGGTRKDVYSIEVVTGRTTLVKGDLHGQVYPSYNGNHIAWYDRAARHYMAWDGRSVRNISASVKVPLWNEESDLPDDPVNYGVMGWHEGDSALYVYDRYDVWKLPLEPGQTALNITGQGRSAKARYRYLPADPDLKFFRSGQSVLFRVFGTETKTDALLEGRIGSSLAQQEVERCDCQIGPVTSARKAPVLAYTKETFRESPDLYVRAITSPYPEKALRLSALNPQQADYRWGTAELFRWKAYNGREATGLVYKPDGFDPRQKYPVIVYFYERLSDGLHDYKEPAPIRSAVNVPFFVSRGYIVFMPDIEYRIGYPGQSAYDYIVSGARALVRKGWADSTRMGLQGHSWGGYQAAQVATMTSLFRAVWAGAPVANMTSAYGGIRWESGASRQFQYERSQSRIGATLWERPDLYVKNSPLFHLDKVTAPIVMMHNDADGAVPWYQGIELFTALRRLGKKVWMFNYNGQGHGLTQRPDMRDYQIRMQQFFDHLLKGEKPARWITEGVPAVRKGKDWGLETVD